MFGGLMKVQMILVGRDDIKNAILDDAFIYAKNKENGSGYTINEIEIEGRQVKLSIHSTISQLEKFKCENTALVYVFADTDKNLFENIETTRGKYKGRFPKAMEAILFLNSNDGLKEDDLKRYGDKIHKMGILLYKVDIDSEEKYLEILDNSLKDFVKKAFINKGNTQKYKGNAQQYYGNAQQYGGNAKQYGGNAKQHFEDSFCGCCRNY